MEVDLFNYLNDGAKYQARAVLAFLSRYDGINESWSSDKNRYLATPKISRWGNGREQGYVISMWSKEYYSGDQINIAFFEHRNSDAICAVKWIQRTINAPTIDTAKFKDIYKDKYDLSISFGYGEVAKMADWIYDTLEQFWVDGQKE